MSKSRKQAIALRHRAEGAERELAELREELISLKAKEAKTREKLQHYKRTVARLRSWGWQVRERHGKMLAWLSRGLLGRLLRLLLPTRYTRPLPEPEDVPYIDS